MVTGCPAVFLDRDGVLNRSLVRDGKPYAPRNLSDFHILPEAAAALARLKAAGYLLVVVTNQPDIGNALVDPATVAAMHDLLRKALPIDDIRCCPHTREDGCACRKPRPGMLLDAAAEWNIDLAASAMIGDRAGDMAAGRAAGCGLCIFIDRGYAETGPDIEADLIVRDLGDAVGWLLESQKPPIAPDS